jgi:hypothetical protein
MNTIGNRPISSSEPGGDATWKTNGSEPIAFEHIPTHCLLVNAGVHGGGAQGIEP